MEETLSAEAENAWRAYLAMKESKLLYFHFLQQLDQKYSKNESPSIAENLKMEQFLKTHDINVRAFNEAMQRIEQPEVRQQLMAKLAEASSHTNAH
jgi:hypothetical protein